MTREVQVSKKMSWLLRHGAEKEGLVLGSGGYMGVNDVVSFLHLTFFGSWMVRMFGRCLSFFPIDH